MVFFEKVLIDCNGAYKCKSAHFVLQKFKKICVQYINLNWDLSNASPPNTPPP